MSSPNPIYDQLCAERGHNPLEQNDLAARLRALFALGVLSASEVRQLSGVLFDESEVRRAAAFPF